MSKDRQVQRPIKKSEYTVICATRAAQSGWRNLLATQRNALVETWDFLTRTPLQVTPTNYPLKGALSTVTRNQTQHERWQHKPTAGGAARIWFYVDGQTVHLEQVHTSHPNQTK